MMVRSKLRWLRLAKRRPLVAAQLAWFLIFMAAAAYCQDTTARDVYKKAVGSVVVVMALDANDQPTALGTGFYVGSNSIATNLHVVRNAKRVRVFSASNQKENKANGIRAVNAEHDLAILSMEDAGQPLALATSKMEVGDPVFAIGNPRGLDATLSTGIVSAVRTVGKTAMYQITAPISPGSSGGPVLNSKAQVIGVSTSYLDQGQNLNFAVDVQHLSELMALNQQTETQPFDVLTGLPPSGSDKRKSALDTVRVVSPSIDGSQNPQLMGTPATYKLSWDVSFRNDGDKAVKDFDVLILVFDRKNKELIHYVRKKIPLSVPPRLAKRTHFEEGNLDFYTGNALFAWTCEYRILDFKYDE